MLSIQDFFIACAGTWTTERTYHFVETQEIERSHTEFQVTPLSLAEKERILAPVIASDASTTWKLNATELAAQEVHCPGFAIAFDTVSDKGERVAMSLNALFIPETYVSLAAQSESLLLPLAAQVPTLPTDEVIQGLYLRDEGYSESGSVAGRFTYQPTRQTLEMTTHYRRSVAVDQMRLIAPNVRLRTIVTYQRPAAGEVPSVITLIGFGVEHKD